MRQYLVRKSTIVILVVFVCVGFSIFIRGNDLKPLERTVDVNLLANQQSGIDYLETFDNAELKNGIDEITYIGYKNIKDFYTVDYLSETNDDLSEYRISFEVLYIKSLDLLYIDVSLIDTYNNIVDTMTLNGYAFKDTDEIRNVEFDLYGYSFYATDLLSDDTIDEVAINSNFVLAIMTGDGGVSGGIVYPIVNVSNSIVGIDDAINNAEAYLNPPDIWYDGPMKYFMWKVKLEMAKDDFIINSALETEAIEDGKLVGSNGYIGNQSNSTWDSWEYGLSNLGDAGCGIFAMFNFLKDTGYDPHLSTLIALTQLMNADVAFGLFGTNAYPDDMLFMETTVFDSIIQNYIIPIAVDVIPKIAATLINTQFENASDWWLRWFGWTYDVQVVATTAVIETAFFALFVTADALVEWYWSSTSSVTEVLSLYGFNDMSNTTNLDSFITNSEGSQYFIVSFWYDIESSTNTIDFTGSAHTVFVRRLSTGNFRVFNLYGNGIYYDYTDLYKVIDSDLNYARIKLLSGIGFY
ncbi:MAG: hypothetical protein K8Q99_03525 [Acholeplasmataceae bacterium]|nr:hypothetical protein [Acholeplasmataceae bacterium]